MKKIQFIIKSICLILIVSSTNLSAQAPNVNLGLVESKGDCGLQTDCANDLICFDLEMTVDQDKKLDSYNIWLQYDNKILSRVNGGEDNSCVIANGGDSNIETLGGYRITGSPSGPYDLLAGVSESVHTICFKVINSKLAENTAINVGGRMFGQLRSTVTFDDASNGIITESFAYEISSNDVSCFSSSTSDILVFEVEPGDSGAILSWEAIEYSKNGHFDIERSTDGKEFENIGFVSSRNKEGEITSYQFLDLSPQPGINFYRLKRVDPANGSQISEIRNISFQSNINTNSKLTTYPNPAVNEVFVQLNALSEVSQIKLLNANGVLLQEFKLDAGIANRQEEVRIDVNDYPPGVFYVLVVHEGNTEISQVVKVSH